MVLWLVSLNTLIKRNIPVNFYLVAKSPCTNHCLTRADPFA
jgi:hypothetical protein